MQNIHFGQTRIPGTLIRFTSGSVALVGSPGSGKTTLGYLLCQGDGLLVSDGLLHVSSGDGLVGHPPFYPQFRFGFPAMLPEILNTDPDSMVDQETGKLITLVKPDVPDTGLPAQITDVYWVERTSQKRQTIFRASLTEMHSLLMQAGASFPENGLDHCRLYRLRLPGDAAEFKKAAMQILLDMKALQLIQPSSL